MNADDMNQLQLAQYISDNFGQKHRVVRVTFPNQPGPCVAHLHLADGGKAEVTGSFAWRLKSAPES